MILTSRDGKRTTNAQANKLLHRELHHPAHLSQQAVIETVPGQAPRSNILHRGGCRQIDGSTDATQKVSANRLPRLAPPTTTTGSANRQGLHIAQGTLQHPIDMTTVSSTFPTSSVGSTTATHAVSAHLPVFTTMIAQARHRLTAQKAFATPPSRQL